MCFKTNVFECKLHMRWIVKVLETKNYSLKICDYRKGLKKQSVFRLNYTTENCF